MEYISYRFWAGPPHNELKHSQIALCAKACPDVKVYRTSEHGYMVEGWEEPVKKFSDRIAFMQEEF